MIKFKELSIQNFLSYGAAPTVINLDPGGTTLIVGEDLDNTASGTGANGVGKTVWLNALVFALYGVPISKISMDNLVNNINNTHLEVILEFQKDNFLYVVKRVRKEKGLGNYAKIFKRAVGVELDMDVNSPQDVTPDSVGNINKYIEDVLGIPYELFVRIVAFSATHKPFLEMSGPEQSSIMEELFRLNRLSEKSVLLKAAIKDAKASMEIKQNHNAQLEKEHERHNTLLDAAKERIDVWKETSKNFIAEVDKGLKDLKKHDIVGQEKLFDDVTKQNNVVTELGISWKKIDDEIKELSTKYGVAEKEIKILGEQFDGMQDKVDVWNHEHKANVEAHEAAKEGLVPEVTLDEQQTLHQEMEAHNENREKLKVGREDVVVKIEGLEGKIKNYTDDLVHLEDANCPYCLQKFESAEEKIAEYKANLEVDDNLLKAMTEALVDFDKKIAVAEEEANKVSGSIIYTQDDINIERTLRTDLFKKIDELAALENPFTMDEAQRLEERIKELDVDMEATDITINDLSTDKESIEKEIAAEEVILGKLVEKIEFTSLEELWDVKNEIKMLTVKKKELKEEVNPHQESYKELKAVKLDPIDMDTVNQLDKLMTHQNYLLKLLTKKDSFIRKNLLNKNLEFLNSRLRTYLTDLGLPHRVEFTQEMSADISQFGRKLDWGNLSSGQKARVNLGLSFSFRDVLERSLDSVNVCMLDEVLDVGLDTVGVQNAAHMLKRKAREDELTLFIISHRDEVSGIFDKTLTVTMEKGFSSVSQE